MTRSTKRATPKPLPPIDAEGILQVLANVRDLIPQLNKEEALPPRKRVSSEERMASSFTSADALEEFGYETVIEGLESVAQDIGEALEQNTPSWWKTACASTTRWRSCRSPASTT